MKKTVKAIIFLVFVIIWMVCIYMLSEMNGKNSGTQSKGMISDFIENALGVTNEYGLTDAHPSEQTLVRTTQLVNGPLRKLAHATVYFILAFIIMIFLNILFNHKKYWIVLIITAALCIAFAITDEYHQTFVKGRIGNQIDVVIDSTGTLVRNTILFNIPYNIQNGIQKCN